MALSAALFVSLVELWLIEKEPAFIFWLLSCVVITQASPWFHKQPRMRTSGSFAEPQPESEYDAQSQLRFNPNAERVEQQLRKARQKANSFAFYLVFLLAMPVTCLVLFKTAIPNEYWCDAEQAIGNINAALSVRMAREELDSPEWQKMSKTGCSGGKLDWEYLVLLPCDGFYLSNECYTIEFDLATGEGRIVIDSSRTTTGYADDGLRVAEYDPKIRRFGCPRSPDE